MERVNCKKTPLEPLKKRCRALMACPYRRVLSAMHPLYQPTLDEKKNGILGLGIAGPQIGDMVSYYRYSNLEPKLVTYYSSSPPPHSIQNLISEMMIKSMFQEVLVQMKALLAEPQSNGSRQWYLWRKEEWDGSPFPKDELYKTHPGKANWMELSMNGNRSTAFFPWLKRPCYGCWTVQEWALRLMIIYETWLRQNFCRRQANFCRRQGVGWLYDRQLDLPGPYIPVYNSSLLTRFAYASIAARIAWPWGEWDECRHMLLRGYWVEVSVVYVTDTHYDTVLRLAANPPLLALGDNIADHQQYCPSLEWPIQELYDKLNRKHYQALTQNEKQKSLVRSVAWACVKCRLGSDLSFAIRAEKAWTWYKQNDMQLASTIGDNIVLWDFIMTIGSGPTVKNIANMRKTDFCNNPEAVTQVEALMIQYGEFTAPAKRRRRN